MAFELGSEALPEYSHSFSPKKFTLAQLFACLVFKSSLKLDYRGVVELLSDSPDLCRVIELKQVPHYTTLQKSAARLLKMPIAEKLLARSLRRHSPRRKRVKVVAIDSTGLESHHCSRYFVKRRSRIENLWQTTTYRRFPKLGIVCDISTHLILAIQLSCGPSPDVDQLKKPIFNARFVTPIGFLLADAGYDSESNHQYCRNVLQIKTIIPATHGRPTSTSEGQIPRINADSIQQKAIWSALASGNRDEHDQTTAR